MSTLTVTAKGKVTLGKDILKHLGVQPGEKITVNKLPNGRIELKAALRARFQTFLVFSNGRMARPYQLRKCLFR
jgi:AbrB family looped-hinge helix DNA binding protein